ncbi:hypothetical protein GCM10012290_22460 [Halolactibacillus alkaliphilus]|uniref:DUF4129 domain-containing protein n=1 Tax=Halolactibacillus alkaliphilus TaxID=442899 RepID=A0A511X3X0_9BACI|nr:DUF4129 domain-containing protein [Halolactibacillus alkaliphilus]GEN57646.1 hypothetical protein HAL01_21100 [Halolactibacillus alkaliphilus]GGN74512.1 hypothetical protein GCM10012290_22460 [Halolactibacillus alkaliphilus]SFP02067.1 hypothetical protein SAMN05720591_13314 [Halolactibacillus alkaliphilus]
MLKRAWLYSILESLSLFPFFLWMNTLFLSQLFSGELLLIYFIVYPLSTGLAFIYQHFIARAFFTTGILALVVYFVPFSSTFQVVTGCFIFCILIQRGVMYRLSDPEAAFPRTLMWTISLPSYFVSYFFYHSNRYEGWLVGSALILIINLLIITNQEHLITKERDQYGKTTMLGTIRRQNFMYLGMLMVSLFLLLRYNVVATGLVFVLKQLFKLLGQNELAQTPPEELPGPQSMDLSNIEIREPSAFALIVDKILEVIMVVIVSLAIVGLLYLLIKRLPVIGKQIEVAMKRMFNIIFNRRRAVSFVKASAYEDETSQVFHLGEWLNQRKLLFKREKTVTIRWQTLSTKKQVRYLYEQLIKKGESLGISYQVSLTAKEYLKSLPERLFDEDEWQQHLTELYNKARYSTHDVHSVAHYIKQLERND